MQSMLRTRLHRFEGAARERQMLRRLATFADKCLRRLEQHLGGALFKRKPEIELTVLGHAAYSASPRTQILLAKRLDSNDLGIKIDLSHLIIPGEYGMN